VLHRLKAADGLAELPPHLRVLDGLVHHRLRSTEGVSSVGGEDVVDERLDCFCRGRREPLRRCILERHAELLARLVDTDLRRYRYAHRRCLHGEKCCAVTILGQHEQHVGCRYVRHRRDHASKCHVRTARHSRRPRAGQRADGDDHGTVGDPAHQGGSRALGAHPQKGPRRRNRARQPWSRVKGGAQFLGDDPGFHHRHARAVAFRWHKQTSGAQFGESSPHFIGCAGWILKHRPHMCCHACFLGEELSHGVTQCALLVGQLQVHWRGNPRTRCAVMFLLIWVVPPAIVSERDDRRWCAQRPSAPVGPRASKPKAASS